MDRLILLAVCVFEIGISSSYAELRPGMPPDKVILSGKSGGRTDGGGWSSSEIRDKTYVLFYVDPDEKELNEHVGEAIQRENFNGDEFGSIAVINMEATIIPNWLLAKLIAAKQKKYPRTIYVYDKAKILVERWRLADDNYDVVLFSRDGNVLYMKNGRLTTEETEQLIQLIRTDLKHDRPTGQKTAP